MQIISRAAAGHKILRLGGVILKLFAHTAHRHIHCAQIAVILIAPYLLHQLLTGDDSVGSFKKIAYQFIFTLTQIHSNTIFIQRLQIAVYSKGTKNLFIIITYKY